MTVSVYNDTRDTNDSSIELSVSIFDTLEMVSHFPAYLKVQLI